MKRCLVLLRCAVLMAVVLTPLRAAAQETGSDSVDTWTLFDSKTVQDVRLFVSTRDLAELRAHYDENTYYPADFLWRGQRVRNVGIRVRGLATRSATKPGLRIDFNRYISGQKFLGLRSLVLDNNLKDDSMIRDRTSMEFIARMGQPGPRESFARVYINNKYEGLYALVEPVDTVFLKRVLGEGDGYLYDYHFDTRFDGEYLGDDINAYKSRFEAQTHTLEPDSMLYSPIRDLFREVNHDVDGAWRERVNDRIDVRQVITYVAIESFLTENDGFVGSAGMANFYFYRPADSNTHRVLPWDRDTTFQKIETPLFERTGDNVLVSRLLKFDDLHDLYLDVLERCAHLAADHDWLESEITRVSDLIREAVYADGLKLYTNEEYEGAIQHLRDYARQRPAFVLDEIARARRR